MLVKESFAEIHVQTARAKNGRKPLYRYMTLYVNQELHVCSDVLISRAVERKCCLSSVQQQ